MKWRFIVLAVVALFILTTETSWAQTKKSTAPPRGYYLTKGDPLSGGGYDGAHAKGACAVGYHVVSLWEIHEPSNLSYGTTLGLTTDDSGSGPPTTVEGWIRTGFPSINYINRPGAANCNAWTTTGGAGTLGRLVDDWLNLDGTSQVPIKPWTADFGQCSVPARVWCVQD